MAAPFNQSDLREVTVQEPTLSNRFVFNNLMSDEQRLAKVVILSVILFGILSIFLALKTSGSKLNEVVVIFLIVLLVLVFQIYIVLVTALRYPENNSIFDILFILLLSTAISFIEVIVVSSIAAFIILGLWGIFIGFFVCDNLPVIWNEDIVFSKGIKKLIALIWVAWVVYVVKCIAVSIKS